MKNIKVFSIAMSVSLLSMVFISSCKKDGPLPPATNGTTIAPGDGAFIIDEGNFQAGNAKLSFYNFSTGNANEDLFQPMNNVPLGDVGQSVTFINGNAYVVVNNSGKIEVVNPANGKRVATITGFTSPRYILPISSTKAYVTDLYSNSISIVNLSTNTRTSSFAFPGQSEYMAMIGNEIFVSCLNSDKVYVINSTSDAIVDSVAIAKGGNSMVTDNNGKLWVLCYGDYFTSAPGGLYRINPATRAVEVSLPFTTSESPTRLCSNSTKDTLYYLNYSVYRFTSTASALPSSAFINATTQSFYGLGIRPGNGEVFVTDAVDYSQRGHLLRYSAAGVLEDDDLIGVIPGSVYFY